MKIARRTLLIVAVMATLITSLAVLPSASAAVDCAQYYTVQRGDNLFRISLRFGTTVDNLMSLNGIANRNLVYTGQQLCVKAGVTQPPPVGRLYTVQWGDTLGKIARTFGVDMNVLARVNNVINVNLIYVGQVLTIPDFTTQ